VGIVDKGSQTVKGMLAEAEEGEEILSTVSGFLGGFSHADTYFVNSV
jgi:hypothetical protein